MRPIRTPFRNTEIMTARGFGKRSGEDGEYSEVVGESKKKIKKKFYFINEIFNLRTTK